MKTAERVLEDAGNEGSGTPDWTSISLGGSIAWSRASLHSEDGVVALTPKVVAELDELVEELRRNPLPTELLIEQEFELPACRDLVRQCKGILQEGVGFVIIDRLPMDRYTVDEARSVYWLLSQMVARPVAQNWSGRLVYDVRDLGRPPGDGVRPDVTNAEQNFHTDNSYNVCPPDYVALLCVRPAKEGGVSSIVSFYTVLEEMRRLYPDKVEHLFKPYLFDRQREHAPDAPRLIRHPLVQAAGEQLMFRLSHRHVVTGYKMAGIDMDAAALDALETFEELMLNPKFTRDFYFEPGQIQIVDNRRCGHRRTGYVDFDEFDRKRHLIRLWLRDSGRRFYNG